MPIIVLLIKGISSLKTVFAYSMGRATRSAHIKGVRNVTFLENLLYVLKEAIMAGSKTTVYEKMNL